MRLRPQACRRSDGTPCPGHPLDPSKSDLNVGRFPGSRVIASVTPSRIEYLVPVAALRKGRACVRHSPLTVAGTAAALGQAPHRIPIYARLIGHRRDQWHRNPGAGCGYNVRNRLCQRRAMRRTEGGEGEGFRRRSLLALAGLPNEGSFSHAVRDQCIASRSPASDKRPLSASARTVLLPREK